MRTSIVVAAVTTLALGCKSKPSDAPVPAHAPANLADLDASLDPARTAFNAHKGEARFLTLLSPT